MVAAIVNFNFFNKPPIEPEPMMVEFEAIAKKAAAPTIGNPPPQPKDAKIAEETTKAPPPKTAEPPRAAARGAQARRRGGQARAAKSSSSRSPSPSRPSRPRTRSR